MEVDSGQRGEEFNSRFKVLDRPNQHPGCCCVCGSVDRPVVDFGADIDWEHQGVGRAYFCEDCIKQAASKFPELEQDENTMVNAAYKAGIVDAGKMVADELRIMADRLNSFNPATAVPINIVVNSVLEQTEPSNDPEPESDVPAVSGFNPETDEPSKLEGPPRVPSDSSDGSFEFKF